MLYDPAYSEKGALLAAVRKPRPDNPLDFQVPFLYRHINDKGSCITVWLVQINNTRDVVSCRIILLPDLQAAAPRRTEGTRNTSDASALSASCSRPQAPLIIRNPHALPMYRDETQQGGGGRKRKVRPWHLAPCLLASCRLNQLCTQRSLCILQQP